jgi:hypothetical protein
MRCFGDLPPANTHKPLVNISKRPQTPANTANVRKQTKKQHPSSIQIRNQKNYPNRFPAPDAALEVRRYAPGLLRGHVRDQSLVAANRSPAAAEIGRGANECERVEHCTYQSNNPVWQVGENIR